MLIYCISVDALKKKFDVGRHMIVYTLYNDEIFNPKILLTDNILNFSFPLLKLSSILTVSSCTRMNWL